MFDQSLIFAFMKQHCPSRYPKIKECCIVAKKYVKPVKCR